MLYLLTKVVGFIVQCSPNTTKAILSPFSSDPFLYLTGLLSNIVTPGNHLRQRHKYKWYTLQMSNQYCVSTILLLENSLIDLAASCMQSKPSPNTYKNILNYMEQHTLYHKFHTKSKNLDSITNRLVSMMPIALTASILCFQHIYNTSLNITILLIMTFIRLSTAFYTYNTSPYNTILYDMH